MWSLRPSRRHPPLISPTSNGRDPFDLLVSGDRDDATWGIVGAFWLADEGDRGGFLVSPDALWTGSEMVRSYRGALARGWTHERIYRYWEQQVGSTGTYMVDPEERASGLFLVARRVGSI